MTEVTSDERKRVQTSKLHRRPFGGYWNVVQIRLHDDEPVKEVPVKNLYPEEYAFMDEPEPEIEPEPEVEPEPKVSESTEPQKTIKERIDILTE
jgi:hypothetical protein